jgi:hypothetical protein
MWIAIVLFSEPYHWTEDVCSVALALFKKTGATTTEASLVKLIGTLQWNATVLCKSSKFAKLVIEICKSSQHQAMVREKRSALITWQQYIAFISGPLIMCVVFLYRYPGITLNSMKLPQFIEVFWSLLCYGRSENLTISMFVWIYPVSTSNILIKYNSNLHHTGINKGCVGVWFGLVGTGD